MYVCRQLTCTLETIMVNMFVNATNTVEFKRVRRYVPLFLMCMYCFCQGPS